MALVANDRVLVRRVSLLHAVFLCRLFAVTGALVAGDRATGDISQRDPAVGAGLCLRVVETHIARDQVAAAPVGVDAVLPIGAAYVVRDYVEPITTGPITQAPDPVPGVIVEQVAGDGDPDYVGTEVQTVASIMPPDVVREERAS